MRTTLSIPPGIQSDSTPHGEEGQWIDASNVRFTDDGAPEVIHGWESVTKNTVTGVCRTVFDWTDNRNNLTLAFGTHSNLNLWQGGALYDVTPTLALPPVTLSNAITTTANSTLVVVTQLGHPYVVGDNVAVTVSNAVGGITPTGNATITAATTDSWTYTWTSNATANATGGSAVSIAPKRAYTAGQINGTGSAGYGTGGFGVGGYGMPSTIEYFPRTWSFGAWGENLLANFRDGPIYAWINNAAVVAAPLANAPARVTNMLVAPTSGAYQVFALGCNEEASGVYNPMCIRHSSIRKFTEWNTSPSTTAREYTLPGGGRIVAGRMVGASMLVWTTDALFVGSFIGNINAPWRFDRVGRNCGLIGPNAVVVVGQSAFWISPDRQFYSFSGAAPTVINCPIRAEFAANLAASQGDKIVASSVSEYGEVRWDYPDARDGYENSRYLSLKVAGRVAGIWTKGIMARTAMVDAGPSAYPCGVTFSGNVYWHERGTSADGNPLAWFIESADQMISEDRVLRVASFWPDFKTQLGPITLALTTRFKPQGAERTKTYNVAASDQKVDVAMKGRYLRLKFCGNSSPTGGRIGAPVFDIRTSSRR